LESFYRKINDTLKKSKKDKFLNRMIGVSNAARKTGIDLRKQLFAVVRNAFGGKLNTIVCGGAPINQKVVDFFQSVGITVINGYGITECSPLIAANRNDGTKNGRCGYPISTATVKIKNPDENGEGEIAVKGSSVMMGYYKDPDATAQTFDNDGYFLTGDYGKFDDHGYLYITGRLKNLIILSNGKNVYPEEIETELSSRIPGLLDVVVYEGISKRGQEHNAVVAELFFDAAFIKKEGVEDIHAYCRGFINDYNKNAVPYKKIGIFKIRDDEFPKNTLRKIMRFQIDKTIE
jgi:long-chain acyl-CoA synthetase